MRLYGGSDQGQWDMARRRRSVDLGVVRNDSDNAVHSPREDGDEGGSVACQSWVSS